MSLSPCLAFSVPPSHSPSTLYVSSSYQLRFSPGRRWMIDVWGPEGSVRERNWRERGRGEEDLVPSATQLDSLSVGRSVGRENWEGFIQTARLLASQKFFRKTIRWLVVFFLLCFSLPPVSIRMFFMSFAYVCVCLLAYWLRFCMRVLVCARCKRECIHSDYVYSASSSTLLLGGAPYTARILCRSFTPKRRHRQLRAKDLPKVPTWRLERESNPWPFGL